MREVTSSSEDRVLVRARVVQMTLQTEWQSKAVNPATAAPFFGTVFAEWTVGAGAYLSGRNFTLGLGDSDDLCNRITTPLKEFYDGLAPVIVVQCIADAIGHQPSGKMDE